ncbi:MAG: glycosyltransferase [Pseudomonadota bacterium]
MSAATAASQRRRQANQYLLKHQLRADQVSIPPADDLHTVVVMPAYDEPHLEDTLHAFQQLEAPTRGVELLVVINESETETTALQDQHARQAKHLNAHFAGARFPIHVVHHHALPQRHAGVGLARKLGMDEALSRLCQRNNPNGLIVGLDADCRCDANYLCALEAHFERFAKMSASTIYFEHPLRPDVDPQAVSGMIRYELFLRYHVRGLRFAKSPAAFHTLGSCLAVRGLDYARQGGMNRRQGGEDFYFLQKYFRLQAVGECLTTRVEPSARVSARAPFGTGAAQHRWSVAPDPDFPVYDPRGYDVLREVFQIVRDLEFDRAHDGLDALVATRLGRYLRSANFPDAFRGLLDNVATTEQLRQKVLGWFDGFRALKALHWLTDQHWPKVPIAVGVEWLMHRRGVSVSRDVEAQLAALRTLDRTGDGSPAREVGFLSARGAD